MRILRIGFFFILTATAVAASAQSSETLPFTLKPLGHGVYAAIDDAKGDAGANAGFVIGDNGVLVVDTFENERAARALLSEIRKLTPLPIRFVVNTHYHLDHVAGNRIFQDAGAVVIAHRNVGAWIHTENLKFFGKNIKPEQKAEVEALGAPDIFYDDALTLRLGSREIAVTHLLGHTGGDSVVRIEDAKVTFWGDLFWRKTLPNLIDATTADWSKTLSTDGPWLKRFEGTEVPGHGDVGTIEDVREFGGYLNDLREIVKTVEEQKKSGDELVAAVLPEIAKKYGKWEFFEYFAKPNIKDMDAELRGTKRKPGDPQR
ncbi:MAG: MBL fold metallo-hydrolase [Acidobacteria bacterium]|nr:MBL fold metallo-hydrolase [Acidobacteriota bacterium]MBS1864828.1 MBL fold metallo-hydrolase [Acidobacteriota bacterium]